MATAAVVSAATTFILTRRYFIGLLSRQSAMLQAAKVEKVKPAAQQPSNAVESPDSGLSYLCNACGVEKYSPAVSAEAATLKGPVKMVILVRTDLNMVTKTMCALAVLTTSHLSHTFLENKHFRVKAKLLLSVVMRFWLLTRPLSTANQTS